MPTTDRIPQPTPPYAAGASVRRSTRIARGGYTGQRDQWETGNVEVVVDEDQPDVVQIGQHAYRTADLVDALERIGVLPRGGGPTIHHLGRTFALEFQQNDEDRRRGQFGVGLTVDGQFKYGGTIDVGGNA